MIHIGLAGWGDHASLYEATGSKPALHVYSSFFPIVELDASFYAVQPKRNMEKWAKETPDSFRFVVKAYQGMTGHQRGCAPFLNKGEMFDAFIESLTPLLEKNKLAMILCQFPPWFDCKKEHVQYLRYVKEKVGLLPAALEFRHQSWFTPAIRGKTLAFMKDEQWIHSICDEPQAGLGSIPAILEPTDSKKTLIRFHGRNRYGWNNPGVGNWRDVRYLYRYSERELLEWKTKIEQLKQQTDSLYIIFNNNSGGDAADNAIELISMLGIEYEGLSPRQLDLF